MNSLSQFTTLSSVLESILNVVFSLPSPEKGSESFESEKKKKRKKPKEVGSGKSFWFVQLLAKKKRRRMSHLLALRRISSSPLNLRSLWSSRTTLFSPANARLIGIRSFVAAAAKEQTESMISMAPLSFSLFSSSCLHSTKLQKRTLCEPHWMKPKRNSFKCSIPKPKN
jgi:hypothetical protein